MSTLSQFAGGARAPKVIVQANAVAGWTAGGFSEFITNFAASNAKAILSGALTANTLASVLSITGAGSLKLLGISSVDATSRTLRLELTIDGVVLYDYTSAAIAAAGNGGMIVGSTAGSSGSSTTGPFIDDDLTFKTSCLVRVASSLTETDKIQINAKYWTY